MFLFLICFKNYTYPNNRTIILPSTQYYKQKGKKSQITMWDLFIKIHFSRFGLLYMFLFMIENLYLKVCFFYIAYQIIANIGKMLTQLKDDMRKEQQEQDLNNIANQKIDLNNPPNQQLNPPNKQLNLSNQLSPNKQLNLSNQLSPNQVNPPNQHEESNSISRTDILSKVLSTQEIIQLVAWLIFLGLFFLYFWLETIAFKIAYKKMYSFSIKPKLNNIINAYDIDNIDELRTINQIISKNLYLVSFNLLYNANTIFWLSVFVIYYFTNLRYSPQEVSIVQSLCQDLLSFVGRLTQIIINFEFYQHRKDNDQFKMSLDQQKVLNDILVYFFIFLGCGLIMISILAIHNLNNKQKMKSLKENNNQEMNVIFNHLDTYLKTGLLDNILKNPRKKEKISITRMFNINKFIMHLFFILFIIAFIFILYISTKHNLNTFQVLIYIFFNPINILLISFMMISVLRFNNFTVKYGEYFNTLLSVKYMKTKEVRRANISVKKQNIDSVIFNNVQIYHKDQEGMKLIIATNLTNVKNITAVVGPSGGGKTSLMNVLARLINLQNGQISFHCNNGNVNIDNINYSEYIDIVVLCRQFRKLLPAIPLKEYIVQKNPKYKNENMFLYLLELFNLSDILNQFEGGLNTNMIHLFQTISDNQQTLLFILLKLINPNTKIFIFDETFDQLEDSLKSNIVSILFLLSKGVLLDQIPINRIEREELINSIENDQAIQSKYIHKKIIFLISHDISFLIAMYKKNLISNIMFVDKKVSLIDLIDLYQLQ